MDEGLGEGEVGFGEMEKVGVDGSLDGASEEGDKRGMEEKRPCVRNQYRVICTGDVSEVEEETNLQPIILHHPPPPLHRNCQPPDQPRHHFQLRQPIPPHPTQQVHLILLSQPRSLD